MPCFHPRKGYRAKTLNPTGKRSITFNPKEAFYDLKIDIPCQQCDGCRLERSRQWAIRCMHEAKMHHDNCFITLTYDQKHQPPNGSLNVEHFQNFMKRLRSKFSKKTIRFFHCGEYGELTTRPHYHAVLFGIDLRKYGRIINGEWQLWPWKKDKQTQHYRSQELEKLWTSGNSLVGELTFESAAYVARYILKKCTNHSNKNFFYTVEDEKTGALTQVKEEYVTMSRRPGIAKSFYDKYKYQMFKNDFVIVRGKKMKPPKFYMGQYEIQEPKKAKLVKAKRENFAKENKDNNTHERLLAQERITKGRIQTLKRKYESGTSS